MKNPIAMIVSSLLVALVPAAMAAIPAGFDGVQRIVAIGDIHGDYDKLTAALHLCQLTRLTDGKERWIAGTTHLVQTGDVLGRGSESKRAMDLLIDLEEQATKAGGRVHALIGNHEFMNMTGELIFTSDGELAMFGDGPRKTPLGKAPDGDFPHYRAALSPTGLYGRWISGHNAIVRINGTLFMHGGLSPSYLNRDIVQLNEIIRSELRGEHTINSPWAPGHTSASGVGYDPLGPLFYRGLADPMTPQQIDTYLQQLLSAQKVRRIVVAHTVQPDGIKLLGGDRIGLIDVGMSRMINGAPPTCLVVEATPNGDRVTVSK